MKMKEYEKIYNKGRTSFYFINTLYSKSFGLLKEERNVGNL